MDSDELRISQIANELHLNINTQLVNIQQASSELNSESLLLDLHQFQPCPQLLDQHLTKYIDILLKSYFSDSEDIDIAVISEVFYTFGKIIGVKRLLSYMKTEIDLIPLIISKYKASQDLYWHEEYLLITCLIVLSLVPFDFNTFGDIKKSIYEIGILRINELNAGPLQPLGARLIGSIITRPDCKDLLGDFVNKFIESYPTVPDVIKCGYLQTLNISLQKDANELILIDDIPRIYDILLETENEDGDSKLEYLLKIYSKLCKYFTELDQYDPVDDIVGFFDKNLASKSTLIRSTLARHFSKLITKVDDCLGIDIMLGMLYAAKEQFDQPMELIEADLLHTVLLMIAEMLYKDLVDGDAVKDISGILSKALFFQQIQITYISGANIRDSSNYIIWALSRTSLPIDPEIFLEIFTNSLLCCCFDKELMIRRSSTAALQELIGRHGFKNWNLIYPEDKGVVNSGKNIDLLQALDFVELSSINKSYLEVPSRILKIFPTLTNRFIEFLTQNTLNNLDHVLVKLSAKALMKILEEYDNQQMIEKQIIIFIANLSKTPYNSFIGLSEILSLLKSNNPSYLSQIYEVFNSQKLDHHKTQPFIMESYLQIAYTLLKIAPEFTDLNKDAFFVNLFDLIRVDSESILQYLRLICPLIDLTPQYLDKWLYYMKNNNINTSSTVSCLKEFCQIVPHVVNLLKEDTRIDFNVKTVIINSISDYLKSGNELPQELLVKLIEKLDDYTVSEQGDVGSKIRNSAISLINNNFKLFSNVEDLRKLIELKLLRLTSEPIDSVRSASISLLLQFKPSSTLNVSDFNTRNNEYYFTNSLNYFQENYITDKKSSLEFWKGYIFTGGAIRSTNDLITSNLRSFLNFYIDLSVEAQTDVLLKLASIIRVDPKELQNYGLTRQNRLSKTVLVGMQFISRIFQLNAPIPPMFNAHGFYIRVFNIHLNTTNLTKLSNAIKIFGHLYIATGHKDSLKRLCWLCYNHTLSKVRVLASEELFTIYKELQISGSGSVDYEPALKVLCDVDWSGNRNELKKYHDTIFVNAGDLE